MSLYPAYDGVPLWREGASPREKKEDTVKERVQAALDKVRPALKADGGDVQLIEVTDDGVVKLKLTGACGCCPMSQMTLKMGIEKAIKQEVPEVKEVVAV